MRKNAHARPLFVGLAALAMSGTAHAQRASENAVTGADDAFGTSVGTETTGIYNENDTRGFSPLKAGNYRLDGIYFDPVAAVSTRTRTSSAIRVGFAASDYPFAAPTGIVDTRLRSAADRTVTSAGVHRNQYGGDLEELDMQVPVVGDRLSLAMGLGHSYTRTADGATSKSVSSLFKPVFRLGGAEISPFVAYGLIYDNYARPLVVVTGASLPPVPPVEQYFGQDWAQGRSENINAGITAKIPVTGGIAFRGGLFRSSTKRLKNFTEIFTLPPSLGPARHRLLSDPVQHLHSWSGEVQLAWSFGTERWRHRLIAGFRGRDRYTESGGADVRDYGEIELGLPDPEPEPVFTYAPVNVGQVRQTSWTLGYIGHFAGLGRLNLGLQRTSYRADFRDTRQATRTEDQAWIYNATVVVDVTPQLALFAGTQRGLEDSGAAPENAANRNEQLPTTRSTQYEGGARLKLGWSQVVLSLFEITKPYFSFDAAERFVPLGQVRHRGLEASLAGRLGERLSILAGAVAMDPMVSGPARSLGRVGKRPAGTPSLYARVDVNYRTDIFGGLTPTGTLTYTGRRAAGSRPLASGEQLMLPAHATLDLGLRQQFMVGRIPASFRLVLANVFDSAAWRFVASNTLQADERRRLSVSVAADF